MRTELVQVDWEQDFLHCNDVNDMVHQFENVLNLKIEQLNISLAYSIFGIPHFLTHFFTKHSLKII